MADTAMRSALDESRISYTLGYYPKSGDDGKYHGIRVTTRRADVALRYRSGYDARAMNQPAAAAKVEMQAALESPLDATLLPITAHAAKNHDSLAIQIHIDPSTLMFRSQAGRKRGRVTIFLTFRPGDASGRLQVTSVPGNFDFTPEQYEQFLARPMTFRKELPIPPKATSLRVAVRDEESALLGSVTIPLAAVH